MPLLALRRTYSLKENSCRPARLNRSTSESAIVSIKYTSFEDEQVASDKKRVNHDIQGFLVSECSAFSIILFEKEQLYLRKLVNSQFSIDLISILKVVRKKDVLNMAIRLESDNSLRCYLSLISSENKLYSCMVGFTFTNKSQQPYISIIVPCRKISNVVFSGDGGFKLCIPGERGYSFYPLSIRSLWCCAQLINDIIYRTGFTNFSFIETSYFEYYYHMLSSDPKVLIYWIKSPELASTVKLFYDIQDEKPEIYKLITFSLTKILMSSNVDEITMREIKLSLIEDLNISLVDYQAYIDNEVMRIFGQMDKCSRITDFLYLGSEWNAADRESLEKFGITHIINVSQEIDNFFPGAFEYMNICVEDRDGEEIINYFKPAFKFIEVARIKKSGLLVHCQMGISRSATIVLSYLMKYYEWDYTQAFEFVKKQRNIIYPNPGFVSQLRIYEGILASSRNRIIFNTSQACDLISSLPETKIVTDIIEPSVKVIDTVNCINNRTSNHSLNVAQKNLMNCSSQQKLSSND